MSDVLRYTTWKVPAGWNKLVEAWREKHREDLAIRGVLSNSAAVLFILTRVMEAEGLMDQFVIGELNDFGKDFRLKDLVDPARAR